MAHVHFIVWVDFKMVSSHLKENSSHLFYQNWCSSAQFLTGLHLCINSSPGQRKNPHNEVVICLLYPPIPSLPPLHGSFLYSPPLSLFYVGITVTSSMSSNDVTFHWMLRYFELCRAVTIRWRFWAVTATSLSPPHVSIAGSVGELMLSIWFSWKFAKELKVLFKTDNIK